MKLLKTFTAVGLMIATSVATYADTYTKATVDLQGETFTVDTLRHYKCGPGMTRTAIEYRSKATGSRIHAYVIKTTLNEAKNVEFKCSHQNKKVNL